MMLRPPRAAGASLGTYSGFFDALAKTVRKDGVLALYNGGRRHNHNAALFFFFLPPALRPAAREGHSSLGMGTDPPPCYGMCACRLWSQLYAVRVLEHGHVPGAGAGQAKCVWREAGQPPLKTLSFVRPFGAARGSTFCIACP